MISLIENDPKKPMKKVPLIHVVVYKAKDGYRWHMKRCGKIIAESGEGYVRLKTCTNTLSKLIESLGSCHYSYVTPKAK